MDDPAGTTDPLTGHVSTDIGAVLKGGASGDAQETDLLAVRDIRNLLFGNGASGGQDVWMDYAGELRERATRLAQFAAARDLERCRQALLDLSGTCNRCHQNFRVATRITPFADAGGD